MSILTIMTTAPIRAMAADTGVRLRSEPVQRVTPAPASTGTAGGGDRVSISVQGRQRAEQAAGQSDPGPGPSESKKTGTPASRPADLDMAELRMVERLKLRDREVKAHELAHLANAGQYAAGGPSYTYQQGPDGRRYAVGGEVPIDISSERTPEATIQKMRTVRRAAMAPANPSAADRNIAALAGRKEAEARRELEREQAGEEPAGVEDTGAPAVDNDETGPAEGHGPENSRPTFGRAGIRPA